MSFNMSNQTQDQKQQQDQQRSNSRSLADKRGKNWALPTSNTASIGVQRPIRIECWTDRLVLIPDTRDLQPEVIPLSERTDQSVDQLVGAVRHLYQNLGHGRTRDVLETAIGVAGISQRREAGRRICKRCWRKAAGM